MTISEVAKQTGVTAHAIRFYERTGILPPAPRTRAIRRYGVRDLVILSWVAIGRRVGLPLRDIAATIDRPATDPANVGREQGAALVRRVLALQQREAELRDSLAGTLALLDQTRAELSTLTESLPQPFTIGAQA